MDIFSHARRLLAFVAAASLWFFALPASAQDSVNANEDGGIVIISRTIEVGDTVVTVECVLTLHPLDIDCDIEVDTGDGEEEEEEDGGDDDVVDDDDNDGQVGLGVRRSLGRFRR